MVDVFGFDSYRDVLHEHFRLTKQRTRKKGVVAFAALVGCTPGHVRNIGVGRRKMPPELIEGFCRALGLTGAAADYFADLVVAVHGESARDREEATRRVEEARAQHGQPRALDRRGRGRPKRSPRLTGDDQSLWLHPLLRALSAVPGIGWDPVFLAEVLDHGLSALHVASAARLFPRLRGHVGRGEDAVSLTVVGETTTRGAMRRNLDGLGQALEEGRAPQFRMDTTVWCLRLEQLPTVQALIDEAITLASRRVEPLAARAHTKRVLGERQVTQILLSFWPLSRPL